MATRWSDVQFAGGAGSVVPGSETAARLLRGYYATGDMAGYWPVRDASEFDSLPQTDEDGEDADLDAYSLAVDEIDWTGLTSCPSEVRSWSLHEDNGGGLHVRLGERGWFLLPGEEAGLWRRGLIVPVRDHERTLHDRPDFSGLESEDPPAPRELRHLADLDGWEIISLRQSPGAAGAEALRGLVHIAWLRRGGQQDNPTSEGLLTEALAALAVGDEDELAAALRVCEDWGREHGGRVAETLPARVSE